MLLLIFTCAHIRQYEYTERTRVGARARDEYTLGTSFTHAQSRAAGGTEARAHADGQRWRVGEARPDPLLSGTSHLSSTPLRRLRAAAPQVELSTRTAGPNQLGSALGFRLCSLSARTTPTCTRHARGASRSSTATATALVLHDCTARPALGDATRTVGLAAAKGCRAKDIARARGLRIRAHGGRRQRGAARRRGGGAPMFGTQQQQRTTTQQSVCLRDMLSYAIRDTRCRSLDALRPRLRLSSWI